MTGDHARLDEFDKEEWRAIAKNLDKNYSDERFDLQWAEFCKKKAAHLRRKEIH